jgi:hypothetical protein
MGKTLVKQAVAINKDFWIGELMLILENRIASPGMHFWQAF